MYEIDSVNSDICLETDTMGNYTHHLVRKSSKEMAANMAEASLLMQRELLWFKEVEKIMPAYLTKEKNSNGQTTYELFSKENEDLVSSGLKWMKDCMVVATLIVIVAFVVALQFLINLGMDLKDKLSILVDRTIGAPQEVEKIMPAYLTKEKNSNGQTAYELFTKENEDLVSNGLKWMKDCMINLGMDLKDKLLILVDRTIGAPQDPGHVMMKSSYARHQLQSMVIEDQAPHVAKGGETIKHHYGLQQKPIVCAD
ncbi:hypothetical protein Tco_0345029 [Tanacetum coccineum]